MRLQVKDCLYNSYKRLKNNFKLKHFPLFFVYLLAISFVNVVVFINMIFTETNSTLFKIYVINNKWWVKLIIVLVLLAIYALIISGIFTANIHILEEKKFSTSYKLSCKIVRKHIFKVLANVLVYNLLVALALLLIYIVITFVLVLGVKILDMAYLGSTMYLSVLRTIKVIFNVLWMLISIPTFLYYDF